VAWGVLRNIFDHVVDKKRTAETTLEGDIHRNLCARCVASMLCTIPSLWMNIMHFVSKIEDHDITLQLLNPRLSPAFFSHEYSTVRVKSFYLLSLVCIILISPMWPFLDTTVLLLHELRYEDTLPGFKV
jgi:hypothetical protein